jgi:hypothetical protein
VADLTPQAQDVLAALKAGVVSWPELEATQAKLAAATVPAGVPGVYKAPQPTAPLVEAAQAATLGQYAGTIDRQSTWLWILGAGVAGALLWAILRR